MTGHYSSAQNCKQQREKKKTKKMFLFIHINTTSSERRSGSAGGAVISTLPQRNIFSKLCCAVAAKMGVKIVSIVALMVIVISDFYMLRSKRFLKNCLTFFL